MDYYQASNASWCTGLYRCLWFLVGSFDITNRQNINEQAYVAVK